ncbi:MAG: DNA methyltransferase [Pirellulaceae bacterium]
MIHKVTDVVELRVSDTKPVIDEVKLSAVKFDEGLYPRVEGHDPVRVQAYARDIEQIEAAGKFIAVNAENVLVDGRHRQLAYKKRADGKDDPVVQVYRYGVSSPMETFKLACWLQDRGKSLTDEDRVASAKRLYALGEQSQESIGEALGVSQSTVSKWLARTLKEEKERKQDGAFAMWLSCHSQQEIAEEIAVDQKTVTNWIDGFRKTCGENKFLNFDPPLYNIWKQQVKSDGPSHFGNSEPRWVENLLYRYTHPADIVVDPFGGSGSTINVCKKRFRRYFVSDRKPIIEREHEIRRHDLVGDDGKVVLPKPPQWKDVKLVYLDPPYWLQAEGEYSNAPTDLANMPLDQFNETLAGIINGFAKKLTDAYIALIIQPTQWKAPDRQFTDHVGDMLRLVKLPVDMRISVPYESQQCTAQMVEWAKENKQWLVLTREIVVWKT